MVGIIKKRENAYTKMTAETNENEDVT